MSWIRSSAGSGGSPGSSPRASPASGCSSCSACGCSKATLDLVVLGALALVGLAGAAAWREIEAREGRRRAAAEDVARILHGFSRAVSPDGIVKAILAEVGRGTGADHLVVVQRRPGTPILDATLVPTRSSGRASRAFLPAADLEPDPPPSPVLERRVSRRLDVDGALADCPRSHDARRCRRPGPRAGPHGRRGEWTGGRRSGIASRSAGSDRGGGRGRGTGGGARPARVRDHPHAGGAARVARGDPGRHRPVPAAAGHVVDGGAPHPLGRRQRGVGRARPRPFAPRRADARLHRSR